MIKKRTHAELVLIFDNLEKGTIAEFKELFKVSRTFFKGVDPLSVVEIGEVVYDKDEYTERIVFINEEENRVKFPKKKVHRTISVEEERQWYKQLGTIYAKSWRY